MLPLVFSHYFYNIVQWYVTQNTQYMHKITQNTFSKQLKTDVHNSKILTSHSYNIAYEQISIPIAT